MPSYTSPHAILSPTAGRAAALAAAAASTAAAQAVLSGRRVSELGVAVAPSSSSSYKVSAAATSVTVIQPPAGVAEEVAGGGGGGGGGGRGVGGDISSALGSIREEEEEEGAAAATTADHTTTTTTAPPLSLPNTTMMNFFRGVISEYVSPNGKGDGTITTTEGEKESPPLTKASEDTDEEFSEIGVQPFHALPISPTKSSQTSAESSPTVAKKEEGEEAPPRGVDETLYATLSATSSSTLSLLLSGRRPTSRPLPSPTSSALPTTTPSRSREAGHTHVPLPRLTPPPEGRQERLQNSRLVHSQPLHTELLVQKSPRA